MRTLIFVLLLFTLNAFAAPQPNVWVNPWSTNRSPMPVMATNSLSVSNVIPGGNGSNWNFYGISPSTVARLTDSTNIAQAVVGQSNGLYVLKFNGASDSQFLTNPIVSGQLNFGYPGFAGGDIPFSDGAAGLQVDSGTFWYENVPQILHAENQTNSGTLDVKGVLNTYTGGTIGLGQANPVVFDPNLGRIDIGGAELLMSVNEVVFSQSGGGNFRVLNTDIPANTFFVQGSDGMITNIGPLKVGGAMTNIGPIIPLYVTASKLTAFDANKVLTNSAYSDTDVAALQAATNALTAAIGNTNLYVKIQSGFANNLTSTNGNFYSPTNTAQASNQVVATFQGLTGQSNNLIEWGTNGVRQGMINFQGRLGIGGAPGAFLTRIVNGVSEYDFDPAAGTGFTINNNGATFNMSAGSTVSTFNSNLKPISFVIASTEVMRITNSSLGIGTLNAAARLDVVGGIVCSNLLSTNMLYMKTNSAFVTPVSGQIIFCTSNYDVYVITPTKTNLFATGQ